MFDGRINERDSELLISYLTTPFLRIPLILQFFADETRIHALDHPMLQDVVDACLFEPGLWQSQTIKSVPKLIPPPDRSHLATPVGEPPLSTVLWWMAVRAINKPSLLLLNPSSLPASCCTRVGCHYCSCRAALQRTTA